MRQLGPKNVCSNVYVSTTYYVRLYGCKYSMLIVSSLPEFEWAGLVSHDLAAGGSGLCLCGIDSRRVGGIAPRERPTVVWLNLADIP